MRKKRLLYLAIPLVACLWGGSWTILPFGGVTAAGFLLRALAEWLRARKNGPKWWAFVPLAPIVVPLVLALREVICQEWFWQLAAILLLLIAVAYVFGWLAGGTFEKKEVHYEA